MYKPNYKDGSIVNLMSSIGLAMGHQAQYNPLNTIDSKKLSKSKNIILIILDGLGWEYIKTYGQNSIFNQHIKDRLTSVFPSTTSAAIATFMTGVAPQQHAITGWFMYLKELGVASRILPFGPKYGGESFDKLKRKGEKAEQLKIKAEDIIKQKSFFQKINRKTYYITLSKIIQTENTQTMSKGAIILGYKKFNGFLRQIKRVMTSDSSEKYIYAYWAEFDHLCHEHGITSKEVSGHFQELDTKIGQFIDSIKGTDTTLIITADHGMMDSSLDKTIHMREHPELRKCLVLPLCGEPRAAYAYVHPSKVNKFEEYVTTKMAHICELRKSEDVIKENFYGLFEQNENLFDRVGDYILFMKDDYIIKHYVLGEEEYNLIGNHGGVSKEEMFVPLFVMDL